MTDPFPGGDELMRDRTEQAEALRMGLRRAGLHWIRAGYEVVAGLEALLDEVNRARRESDAATDVAARPERIEIE